MTKSELVEKVAKSANLTKSEAEKAIRAIISRLREAIKKGERIPIPFCVLKSCEREERARSGRNPMTGNAISIPHTMVPKFAAAKSAAKKKATTVVRTIKPQVLTGQKSGKKKGYYTVSVFFGTDRKKTGNDPKNYFGCDRSNSVYLGYCEVSIPYDHRIGELESPSIWQFWSKTNPEKHVVLLKVEEAKVRSFYSKLKKVVSESSDKEVFVFVHGFNVTFEDAVRRTAQIAYDLKFNGVPITYSWPSQGKLRSYIIDEENVDWTIPHLKDFLLKISKQSKADKIHLIAHSMGNIALSKALLRLASELPSPLFHEIILTAPDIDSDTFCNDIAPKMKRTANRVTLYASSNDKALKLSKSIHGSPRAGESGADILVIPDVDTIDVSAVDTNLGFGHSYYGGNRSVISDIFHLIRGLLPDDRFGLSKKKRTGLSYWVFSP